MPSREVGGLRTGTSRPAWGAIAMLSVVLASCGPAAGQGVLPASTAPAVRIGAGVTRSADTLPEIDWTAWAYPARGDDVCLNFVWQDGRGTATARRAAGPT